MFDRQKWKVHHFNKQKKVVDDIALVFSKYYRQIKKVFTQLACQSKFPFVTKDTLQLICIESGLICERDLN